jgi:acetoacetyl-CoA synthetase
VKINPETGGLLILGRSDGVLNPSGVRFGSGDIYAILDRVFSSEIADAICVGQQREKDQSERVLLSIQLPSDKRLSPNLVNRMKNQIANDLSQRHVPHYIFAEPCIPYNVNGKKLEVPLKAVISKGEGALRKRVFAPNELDVLKDYIKYSHIEDMESLEHRKRGPKL